MDSLPVTGSPIPWVKGWPDSDKELVMGKGHPTIEDTFNRPLRYIMQASGLDPDGDFGGFKTGVDLLDWVDASIITGDTLAAKISTAITMLPATGGTVDCRGFIGSQTLGADLVINKPGVRILWGRATINQQAFSITLSSTSHGFSMQGAGPWGSNLVFGGGSTGRGTSFVYTGSGTAWAFGDLTGSTLLRWIEVNNITLHMTGAADTANVVGLWMRRVLFADLHNLCILGSVTSDNQVLCRLDGTGSYTSFVRFTNPSFNGGGIGWHFTGDGVAAANACQITGGNYAGNNNMTSKGILSDNDSNGNRVDGLDVENCAEAYKLVGTSSGWVVEGRIEGNTKDVDFGASTVGNWVKVSHGTIAPNYTDAGKGNTVLGTAGALSFGLPVSLNGAITPQQFGVVGNNVTDDAAAFAATISFAIANNKEICVPPGVYYVNANLTASLTGTAPKSLNIRGVPGQTIIRFGPAVTKGFTLATVPNTDGTTHSLNVYGIRLEGEDTDEAVGWLIGENAGNLSGRITLEKCEALRFTGTGAYGIHVKDVVNFKATRCYFGRNEKNLLVQSSNPDLPTVVTWDQCEFREAVAEGVLLKNGYRIRFVNTCVIEANFGAGLIAEPDANENIVMLDLEGLWVEDNWRGDGSPTDEYALIFDGSASGATLSVRCANSEFSAHNKAAQFIQAVNIVWDNNLIANAADQVNFDANCTGRILNWPENNSPSATSLTNSSTNKNVLYVASASGAPVADATGAGDVVAQLNALLSRLRAQNLIRT